MRDIDIFSAVLPSDSPFRGIDRGTILALFPQSDSNTIDADIKKSFRSLNSRWLKIVSVSDICKAIFNGSLSASLPEFGSKIPDLVSIQHNLINSLSDYEYVEIKDSPDEKVRPIFSDYNIILISLSFDKEKMFVGCFNICSSAASMCFFSNVVSPEIKVDKLFERDLSSIEYEPFTLDAELDTSTQILSESDNASRSLEDQVFYMTCETIESRCSLLSFETSNQSDVNYSEEINIEMFIEELRQLNTEELRRIGLSESALRFLMGLKPIPSHITINRHAKIILNDYNEMEIKLDDKTKTLYFLYLRHPEGIAIKNLPDHIDELMDLYQSVSGRDNLDTMRSTIVNLTDPFQNNANISLSRIKRAFCEVLSPTLAQNYYISGERGEARKILLDRNLVNWETIRS